MALALRFLFPVLCGSSNSAVHSDLDGKEYEGAQPEAHNARLHRR